MKPQISFIMDKTGVQMEIQSRLVPKVNKCEECLYRPVSSAVRFYDYTILFLKCKKCGHKLKLKLSHA